MSTSASPNGSGMVPPPPMSTPRPTAATLRALPAASADAAGSSGRASPSMPRYSGSDGRLTPVAPSEPDGRSSTGSAAPSIYDGAATELTSVSGQSQASSNTQASALAEVGLGSLETEEHLKQALVTKDRMFLLVVSNEVEAFIARVSNGEALTPISAPGPSSLATLSPSVTFVAQASSKYQRLLVYKVAEWYGLKAVSGPESSMVLGVMGSLPPQSVTLRLSELVARPPSPKHSFKIMQRSTGSNSASTASSVVDDDGSSPAAPNRYRTLEEREAAYAQAKERIYGNAKEGGTTAAEFGDLANIRPQQVRAPDDNDPDFRAVPRRPMPDVQPVFGSLGYPHPGSAASGFAPVMAGDGQPGPSTLYPAAAVMNPAYNQLIPNAYANQMGGHQYPGGQAGPMQYPMGMQMPYDPSLQQPMYMAPPYPHAPQGQWQPMPGYGIPPNQYPAAPPAMAPPQMVDSQGWYPQRGIPMMQHQPMPMIPQGMPAFTPPYNSPRPSAYPQLHQPVPQRPQPYPHSSASSSISSRSFHDASRPHSRGSTTSTRSATSSVRLGNMYPASGPGYRQKGMKGQGLGSMTSISMNSTQAQRSHSPSSVASTSSRSSRQAPSISISYPSPSQHQLPQRPDWAANNIPYHPTVPPVEDDPDAQEFPPLHPNRQGGTHAEPMHADKGRYNKQHGTVWNGSGGKTLAQTNGNGGTNGAHSRQPSLPGHEVGPSIPTSRTPVSAVRREPDQHKTPAASSRTEDGDPDFPRRQGGRGPGVLFDPAAPVPTATLASVAPSDGRGSPSPEEIIEAKLAAISLNSGVSIGPAPLKAQQAAPSYAKIVRRA